MKTPTQTTLKKSGFTLIEIVIVLAIAALIIVIVFVAVQGAQRSRRDTARRAAASRVLASLTQCAGDNSGTIGTTASAGPPVTTLVNCGSYITTADGVGSLNDGVVAGGMSVSVPGPYARSAGTGTCPATMTAAMVSTTAGGNVCVYYWSEASASVVLLAGKI